MLVATLRFALWCALGLVGLASPLMAQESQGRILADRGAPGDQRPTIIEAPNGAPVINITTPSAAGVSRNNYSQFDVGTQGAILNNARTNVDTQLGGGIAGNPWLARGTAKVILNEVNGPASQLNGYVEVAGDRAEVIIANPAGIQVNGGGFLIRLIGSRNVKVYPNSTCVSTDVSGSGYPAGPQMGGQRKRDLGMPKTAPMPKHFVEIAARADQPIAAGFSFYAESTMPGIPGTGMPSTTRSGSCYAARSFVPKPGGQYEMISRWSDGCAVDIMRLEQGPDGAWRRVGVLSSAAPGCAATVAPSNSSVSSPK